MQCGLGYLTCRVCGVKFSTRITSLDEPIDVYTVWMDKCRESKTPAKPMSKSLGITESQPPQRVFPITEIRNNNDIVHVLDEVDLDQTIKLKSGIRREILTEDVSFDTTPLHDKSQNVLGVKPMDHLDSSSMEKTADSALDDLFGVDED